MDRTISPAGERPARTARCAAGHHSPELNPIELWWCDMKRTLRTLALDAEADLRRAARRLRACLPLEKIAAWFRFSLRQAQVN